MTVTIGRRELLAALGGAAAAWPLAARAQQPMTEQTITSAAFMMPAPYRQGIYGNWHFGAAFERLCRAMSISSTKAFSQ